MFGIKPHRLYVFGAGPAGLLAALAGREAGMDVAVFSTPDLSTGEPVKSQLYGCQYLHSPIPGYAEGPGDVVEYRLDGSTADYRRKVYGTEWNGAVSPDEYGPEVAHLAWDLRAAYDKLWRDFLPDIVPTQLSAGNVEVFYNDRKGMVFSTIPAPTLCRKPDDHKFTSQQIWAMGSTPYRGLPFEPAPFTVQCNGNDAPHWYRAANVFGHSTLEWPVGKKPPITGVVAVSKPLGTDCDCRTGSRRWHKFGRYGAWRKGVLVHHVYEQAKAVLR